MLERRQLQAITEAAQDSSRLASVSVPRGELIASSTVETFRETGIVVISDGLPVPLALDVSAAVLRVVARHEDAIQAERNERTEELLVHMSQSLLRSWSALAEYEVPVLNVRGSSAAFDGGMLDLFHVDRLLGDLGDELRAQLLAPRLIELLERSMGGKWHAEVINAYVTRSVTRPRGFHVDTFSANQVKVFAYLSDVSSLDSGPYVYSIGSHGSRHTTGILGKYSTDVSAVDSRTVVPVLGTPGTMIVSNQSGAHRAARQAQGAQRLMAVASLRRGA